MKKIIASLSLLGLGFAAHAQAPQHEWTRNFGSNLNTIGTAVAVDNLGDVISVGTFDGTADFDPSNLSTAMLSSAGKEDIFITKMNSKGEYLWSKRIGGTGIDLVHHMKLDGAGNIFIVGSFEDNVDFDPGTGTSNLKADGGSDAYLAKYDINGNLLWAKRFGGAEDDKSIGLTISGLDLVITGFFKDTINFDAAKASAKHTSKGLADIFIAKFDLVGNYQWSHAIGGVSDEEGKSVAIDNSNNILVAGYFNGSVDFDPSASSYYKAATGGRDAYIVKFDKDGAFKWAQSFGGGGYEGVQTILADSSNQIISVGFFTSITDFDNSPTSVYLDPGSSASIFIQKIDSNGNFLWVKGFNGNQHLYSQVAALDHLGNIYLTGYFNTSINFGTGSGMSTLSSSGFEDIFIVKLYPSGNYAAASKIGGTSYESGYSLFMDKTGAMYAIGKFKGTVDFDPGVNIANTASSSAAISDAYVVKWKNFPSAIGTFNNIVPNTVKIYPNPCTAQCTIEMTTQQSANFSIRLKNLLGQIVLVQNIDAPKSTINTASLVTGIYWLEVFSGQQSLGVQKLQIIK